MATARVPAPVRCTRSPPPPNRVTSLSRRASALAFRRANASASSRAAVSGSASLPALDAPPPSDPRTGTTRSLFCFGLGYTSLGLAETLRRAGWRVAGTCRSAERARALEAAGIPAFVWCPDEREFLDDAGVAAPAPGDCGSDAVYCDDLLHKAWLDSSLLVPPAPLRRRSRPCEGRDEEESEWGELSDNLEVLERELLDLFDELSRRQ